MTQTSTCPVIVEGQPCASGQRIVLGRCLYHYKQHTQGRPFRAWTPRRPPGAALIRDEHGRKLCTRCQRWLDVDRFGPRAAGGDFLQTYCRGCSANYMSERRYGLTKADVLALLDDQGGCAICGTLEIKHQDVRRGWHVDHDHKCCPRDATCRQCIRGVLCADCNSLIGYANDNPERLRAAADYCERRHEETT